MSLLFNLMRLSPLRWNYLRYNTFVVIAHRSIADHVGEALQEKVVEKVRPPDVRLG